jgi:sugar phosphate permease
LSVVNIKSETSSLIDRLKKAYYGWYLVPVFGIVMLVATTPLFHAMGIWAVVMERAFGWSRTQLSLALSFTRIEGGILGPIEGYLIDKYGTRRMVLIGMLIMGLGWVIFSFTNHILVFYIAYLVIALGQGLGSWLALNTMLNNWFIRRRSFVMGLSNSISRLGSLFFIPLLAWLVDPDMPERLGWSTTALILGIVIFSIAFPLTRLLRNRPEEYGLLPDGDTEETLKSDLDANVANPKNEILPDFTVSQALRTKAFWFISLGHGFTSMVLLALMLHLAPMMIDMNYSLQTASFVVSAYTAVSMVFQLIGGYVGDRVSKNVALMIFTMCQSAGVFLLTFGDPTLSTAYGFAILFGIGFGGRNPISSSIRGDYFGRKNYGKIMGISQVPMNVLLLIGPIFAGLMRDNTGSYTVAFGVLGFLTAIGGICFLMATRPSYPMDNAYSS